MSFAFTALPLLTSMPCLLPNPCALLAPAGQLNEIPLQLRQREQPSGKPQPMQVYHHVWLALTHTQSNRIKQFGQSRALQLGRVVPDFIKLIDSYHGRSPLFLCSRQCLVCCQTHVPCLLQPVSLTRFFCNCVNGRSPQGNHSQCKCIILSGWPSHTHTKKIAQPLQSSKSANPA